MMRRSYVFPTLFALSLAAFADTHTLDKEKTAVLLDAAAKEGLQLNAKATVQESVGVTAVLLTQNAVRRLFGREISNTYAVVQLQISNKSPDAAFVVHSAYIDTSQWALGGGTKGYLGPATAEPGRAGSRPNRIASVESRIARGELLDAQQWSARNWTVRILTVLGSVASGYTFAFKETGIAKGIAAFNGALVPGVAFAWPDGAVAQQNRISDFGYQTNKVIGKESGEIIVCFFPIDMFLSAPIRELFLKSPGLFLSPYQILIGDSYKKVREQLGLEGQVAKLRELHPCYSKAFEAARTVDDSSTPSRSQHPFQKLVDQSIAGNCDDKLKVSTNRDALVALDYIGRFGLQNIGVYVDGVMTVDVDTVPASIDQVVFDGDASKPAFWAATGDRAGTLQCRFCANGKVSILEAEKLGIADVTTVTDGSGERALKFSFKLTRPIETGQSLTFVITKKSPDPKKSNLEVKSAPFAYTIAYVQVAPAVAKVAVADQKVTVTGSGFFNTALNPLTVKLKSDGKDKDVDVTLPAGQAPDKLTFNVPSNLAPGCWAVAVKVGGMDALSEGTLDRVLAPATPKLTDAARSQDSIAVTGEQLVDTSACKGQALAFDLLKTGETKPVPVTAKLTSPTAATLTLPSDAKTGDWTVRVLQGTEVKSTVKLK